MRLVLVLSTLLASCYTADAFVPAIANRRKPISLGMSSVAVSPSDVTSRLEIQMNKFKSRNAETKKISNNVSFLAAECRPRCDPTLIMANFIFSSNYLHVN